MKDNMLEIGDELYRYIGFSQKGMVIEGMVDKVTKTLAFIGNLKIRRNMGMGFTHMPGASGYSCATYRLVTDEIREEIKRQDIRRELMKPMINVIDNGRGSINRLTNDQLDRINAILQESKATN